MFIEIVSSTLRRSNSRIKYVCRMLCMYVYTSRKIAKAVTVYVIMVYTIEHLTPHSSSGNKNVPSCSFAFEFCMCMRANVFYHLQSFVHRDRDSEIYRI